MVSQYKVLTVRVCWLENGGGSRPTGPVSHAGPQLGGKSRLPQDPQQWLFTEGHPSSAGNVTTVSRTNWPR